MSTPYLIESFKRAWIRDGRVPNFILVDKYYAWLDVSLVTFRNFDIIYGAVTNNNELLNYVNWYFIATAAASSTPYSPPTGYYLHALSRNDSILIRPCLSRRQQSRQFRPAFPAYLHRDRQCRKWQPHSRNLTHGSLLTPSARRPDD